MTALSRPAHDLTCAACRRRTLFVEGVYSRLELVARGWLWTRLEVHCPECSADLRAQLARYVNSAIQGAVDHCAPYAEDDDEDLRELHERLGREPSEDERERFLDLLAMAREQLDETDMSDVPPCERPEYAPHW